MTGSAQANRGSVRGMPVLAAAALCLLLSPAVAQEDSGGPLAGFYSYLPAAPELKLPEISIPFWSDDLKKAKRAYRNGNYGRAAKLFRAASDEGDIVADWYLGHMYRQGLGVPRDDAMAYSYYTRVAEHYDPEESSDKRLRITVDAMVRLADYQRTGAVNAGITPNPDAAAQAYLKVATAYGHPAAQYALGVMNIKGEGMKRNPQQGLKWLMAAARKRYAPAEAYLGELYWEGTVVRADRTRAVMWYILARNSARPEENPEIFDRALQLESNVGEDERIEAEARAKVWDDQYPVTASRQAGD
ncbi:MAG: tetratricopeptide repeat protein [Aestuariivirga sp.]|uniref:tetratricopeptide repeat protein n=1 Tax=Aestuariivirga sp. TaxID=2650926 RepID=UPI0038D14147